MDPLDPDRTLRTGRGALSNRAGRFEATRRERADDGWGVLDEPLPPLETVVLPEPAKTVISHNESPDVPFTQSLNPYRGCEHGCIYCYARPSHAYLNLSPGLDFETRLFYKADAADRLRRELAAKGYRPSPLALGANTDPYQPIERRLGVTRAVLEVMLETLHPVTIVTKSALVLRDRELLAALARERLVKVFVSLTTLDPGLKRRLEPRAASPAARLGAIRGLADAGVPVGVLVAPVIPVLTDHELERLLEAAHEAGAQSAAYILLRLPGEVRDLWVEWLETHEPGKAVHIMSVLRDLRGGRDTDARFGHRMRGQGVYADLLRARFQQACRRLGLPQGESVELDAARFRPPAMASASGQLGLF